MISKNNRLFDIFFEGESRKEFAKLPYKTGDVGLGYVICITPRSGSTFLMYLLINNSFFGVPNEWFNLDPITKITKEKGIVGLENYLTFLWKNYSSEAGVFGMELSYPQYNSLDEIAPIENILGENIRWFYLVRENIVAQAISLYLANATGYFHSYMNIPDGIEPSYDAQEIKKWIDMIIEHETAFERLFAARHNYPVRLSYESMMKDIRSTVALFQNVLGVGQGSEIVESCALKKIGGEANVVFENKFRVEEAVFLKAALERRMPVSSMIKTV